jgi:maleylacetate reductase
MRVRFGAGALQHLPDEVRDLGLGDVLVIVSPGHRAQGEAVATQLGHRCVGVLAEARMHVPIEVATRARDEADRVRADGLVAVGGGSAIGLAKAIALTSRLPIVAVPTTYAGSEMTSIWGLTEGGEKRTGRDQQVLPASVIYDPELTHDLPIGITVTSAINALAHAVEALYAPDISPVIALMAEEGVRALVAALPVIAQAPTDADARALAQYGAWLCGVCLGATTMSLHHKVCHVLGGALDLPHAATHTVVLPHVMAFNLPAAPEARGRLSHALNSDDPARTMWELAGTLGAPRSLRELGMAETDVTRVAALVIATQYPNPRPPTLAAVTAVLEEAWSGDRPGSRAFD